MVTNAIGLTNFRCDFYASLNGMKNVLNDVIAKAFFFANKWLQG
jgi:hypothetical protein